MGEEHLRIRLGTDLLTKIDEQRAESGRTRTGEIKALLEEALQKRSIAEVVRKAVRAEIRRTK